MQSKQTATAKPYLQTGDNFNGQPFSGFISKPINHEPLSIEEIDPFLSLALSLCGNCEQTMKWLLCWLAKPIRNPGFKLSTAVVINSDMPATGKSTFFDTLIGAIYGKYYQNATQVSFHTEVAGINKMFAFIEEVRQLNFPMNSTSSEAALRKRINRGFENRLNCVLALKSDHIDTFHPNDKRFVILNPIKPKNGVIESVLRLIEDGGAFDFYKLLQSDLLTKYQGKPFTKKTRPNP